MTSNQIYYTSGGGDEQYTPAKTVELLLPHIQHLKDKIIWCPSTQEGGVYYPTTERSAISTQNTAAAKQNHKEA